MLNLDENKELYVRDCISCLELVYIVKPNENNGVQILMTSITEEQEKELDNKKSVNIETNIGCFTINPDMCYCYGKFDLSPNSNDIKKIANAKWFDNFEVNIAMPANYDYETHTASSYNKKGKIFETFKPSDFIPYIHGCLGKPERIVIFKDYLKKIDIKARKKVKKQSTKEYKREKYQIKIAAKRTEKINNLKFGLNI